jgi:hypothetical protein
VLTYLNTHPSDSINKRYYYGEIGLPGLNAIYRYSPKTRRQYFRSGYLLGYRQFSLFFKRNFAWMGLGFLYMTAILTAMQVGLAVPYLSGNATFHKASYVFAIFCIILPAAVVARLVAYHAFLLVRFSCGCMQRRESWASAA